MKAIVLAAGRGTRVGAYGLDRPKCLLELAGRSLLQHQIDRLRRFNINDIVVVKGFRADMIQIPGVRYYVDEAHQHNMLFSLFVAREEISGEVLISYADILYDDSVLSALLASESSDIGVVADVCWQEYYKHRLDDVYHHSESFIYNSATNVILNIGEPNPTPDRVQAQYLGLLKLTASGSKIFRSIYESEEQLYSGRVWLRERTFEKAYMTDYLQRLIDLRIPVIAVPVAGGWIEVDTEHDYSQLLTWYREGQLDRFCAID